MAKLKNPLLSLKASGSLSKVISFVSRRGVSLVEKRPVPFDSKSGAQLSWRTMFLLAVDLWHALSAAEKAVWETAGTARHMTGYAWFISQALRPNPGIYLPLAGGTMTGDIAMGTNRIIGLPLPTGSGHAASKSYVDALEARYQIGARVYHNASQSIPNTTSTALAFNSQRWDTDAIHDTVINNSRLTAKTAGKYIIEATIAFEAHLTGVRFIMLYLNGTTVIAALKVNTATWDDTNLICSTIYDLAVNSYVEVLVYQNSGGALRVWSDTNYTPEFMMQRIG